MKILMVNKFLYPNGGSETYIFRLGEALTQKGHEVQFFGMEHAGRCVGNAAEAYTSDMDFHGGNPLSKITYPIKTIYSVEARKKIRLVLDKFKPDVVHLNNFNYQLTPSIILEIVKWRKQTGNKCKIVFTAHDYQLLCPNHMFDNPATHENCEKCIGGMFVNCIKGKCIHGSTAKSSVGAMEAYFWKWKGVYKDIDTIICCSNFMKTKMDTNPIFASKTIAMHNFVEHVTEVNIDAEGKPLDLRYEKYVLYFGRFSQEKGVKTLIEAAKKLPEVNFVFAGNGDLADDINSLSNARNVGFKSGKELTDLIQNAIFTVYPSEWYENCPFSVMESQELGVPVLGANIGGIPELIEDGKSGWLFESGNVDELRNKILEVWNESEDRSELELLNFPALKNRKDADQYAQWLCEEIYVIL